MEERNKHTTPSAQIMRPTVKPRTLLLLIPLLVVGSASAQRKYLGPPVRVDGVAPDTAVWKLVFHDEFDGTELDRSKWVTYFTYSDDGSDQCPGCRFTSNTNSTYRDEHVTVGNGLLTIATKARTNTWYDVTVEHEAGMVHSIGDAQFTYGRFEIRCQVPSAAGLWPAFWGFGGETEIDVFEICGEKPRWMKSSLHRWGEKRSSNTGKHKTQDLSKAFHDYAVEWEENEIRFYLDGEQVYSRSRLMNERGRDIAISDLDPGTYPTAAFFPKGSDSVNIIASLGVSLPNDYCKGPKKPTPWPEGSSLVVDHIRVYQRHPQKKLRDLCEHPRVIGVEKQGSLEPGELRRITLQGPHGDLRWSTSTGLEIESTNAHSVQVRAKADGSGTQWIRVESSNDPCPRGALKQEYGLEIR